MEDNRTFAIMLKPVSSNCNLGCEYCYYLRNGVAKAYMKLPVLEKSINEIINVHGKNAQIEFAWHGGEPLLAGLDFYKKAVELQKKNCANRLVLNTLQTNGVLLNDDFCEFFACNDFLIGISIDGPKSLHDHYRTHHDGEGSFDKTIKGLELLKKHGVNFNTLTTINSQNVKYPKEVYSFLCEHTDFMQFLPVVEGIVSEVEREQGLKFAEAQGSNSGFYKRKIAPFSVSPADFARFLCVIFDEWIKNDYGKKHINIFETTILNMKQMHPGLCTAEAVCGHSLTIESNGDVYSCDRYVYEKYKLGNILNEKLIDIAERNKEFGLFKLGSLKEECLNCKYLRLCFGGCPKDRLLADNKNYLCEGYKVFFEYFLGNV